MIYSRFGSAWLTSFGPPCACVCVCM